MGTTTRCVVGWQSAPPEATAVIKAVIVWTHIFISYWFISNSPLISGGHHRTVAFLLPRLRFSAPPDITVVITALPPRKLFTVSYSSKNWMSIPEEKAHEGKRGEEKKHWLKGRNQRQQGYHLQACSLTKQNYNGCEQLPLCYFSPNCQSACCWSCVWAAAVAATVGTNFSSESEEGWVITSTSTEQMIQRHMRPTLRVMLESESTSLLCIMHPSQMVIHPTYTLYFMGI